jgi:hypothetical protein
MAHVSLADWSCTHNHCIHPLSPPYSTSITSPSRQSYIPFAWALAQKTLSRVGLSLLPSDLSYLTAGDVSLRHLYSQSLHLLPHPPTSIPTRVFSNFERNNLSFLSHFGYLDVSLSLSGPSFLFSPFPLSFPASQYYLTRDFPLILQWFSSLSSLLHTLSSADPSLLLSSSHRQAIAENSITALAAQSHSFSHTSPPSSYATDASTLKSASRTPTTFAVVANNNAFTASLPHSRSVGILHGEAYAIAAASVLACLQPHQITIYSDHLNSVRLLTSHPSSLSLKSNPARSLYRWILHIWDTMPHKPLLTHVRAHTGSQTLPTQLNRLADYLASHSNSLTLPPPSLPLPTFFMDSYIPFSSASGFIESNLFTFCDSQLSNLDASNLDTFHEPTPSFHCFDDIPPPPYPYVKASSSYSMVIQLYIRSGQLDTSFIRASRLKDDQQPWCRFGCPVFEDPHHTFVHCPHFSSLRALRISELNSNVASILQTSSVSLSDRTLILDRIGNLFQDSNVWPSRRSLYYLGVLPRFFPASLHQPQIHIRLANECHITSIRLAAQIWATARCHAYSTTFTHSSPTRTRLSITLPSHLARILPPSPSYPSFSVSFS